MTDIQRAGWVVTDVMGDERAIFNPELIGQYIDDADYRVDAVVKVHPVLEALWAAHDKSTYEGRALLIGLIRQLEKAAQP